MLLENNGILPLDAHENIAVIGSFALRPRYQEAGSSRINPIALDDPWSALCKCGVRRPLRERLRSRNRETTDELLEEAHATAQTAHIAVVIVGLPDRFESEGFDRSDITLPAGHEELLKAVCEANPRTVVVIQGGSPVSLPWLSNPSEDESHGAPQPAAVLLAGLAGCRGGAALARLLLGEANPFGQARRNMARQARGHRARKQLPRQEPHHFIPREHLRRIPMVRRSGNRARLPVRHGLSYTLFHYDGLEIETCEGGVRVAFDLENAGDLPGSEVAQVYIADTNPRVQGSSISCRIRQSFSLQPGRKEHVVIDVSTDDLSYWDTESGSWRLDETMLSVSVGASSRDIRLEGALALRSQLGRLHASPRGGQNMTIRPPHPHATRT